MSKKKGNMSLFNSVKFLYKKYLKREKDPFTDIFEPIVEHPKNGIQRRRFIRMGCMFPAVIDENQEDKIVIINISGNGLFFVSPTMRKIGDTMKISGELFNRKMKINVKITREENIFSELKEIYSYGCEFTGIDEKSRNFIIRSIFSNNRWLKEL